MGYDENMKEYLKLSLLAVFTTLLIWLPFFLRVPSLMGWGLDFSNGMETVFANFDGPNYLIIAKSWYDKEMIRSEFSNPLPLEYYPAHLPLYPGLIYLADLFMPGRWAMLVVTLIGTILVSVMFMLLLKEWGVPKQSRLMMGTVFLLLPARFLIVRSVGSPEPWFIFFILGAIYFYRKEKFLWAALMGVLAQWTKSPAILLFVALCLYHCWNYRKRILGESSIKQLFKSWPILLMPLSVILLFYLYQVKTGDFWAYFNSGDNFHLFWPPFSIFSPRGQFWTGDFWLEEVIMLWLIYGLGIIRLWRKGLKLESIFGGVFFASTLFVAHRDIARYILPIFPLMIMGYAEEIRRKEFKWLLLLLLPAIYLFAWNFMLNNTAPVADWTPYL